MYEDEIPLGRAKDLRGQKFGKLTPLYRTFNSGRDTRWKCQCDCGNITIVATNSLRSGHTKTCGCSNKEKMNKQVRDLTG